MQITRIFEEDYPKNKKVKIEYTSDYFYRVKVQVKPDNKGWVFEWEKASFKESFSKRWDYQLFEPYKGEAEYYVLQNAEDREIGIAVFEHQSHSNRTRVWDIIIQPEYQRKGFGTLLIDFIYKKAKKFGSRALVLECQNTNIKAINFYLKNGFNLIGFDLEAYTQEQGGGIEARFEMSKNLR